MSRSGSLCDCRVVSTRHGVQPQRIDRHVEHCSRHSEHNVRRLEEQVDRLRRPVADPLPRDRWATTLNLDGLAQQAAAAHDGMVVLHSHELKLLVEIARRERSPLLSVDDKGNVEVVRCNRCTHAIDVIAAALSLVPPPGIADLLTKLRDELSKEGV